MFNGVHHRKGRIGTKIRHDPRGKEFARSAFFRLRFSDAFNCRSQKFLATKKPFVEV